MNRRIFPILAIAAAIICLYQAPSAYADCTSPEGAESQTNYDFTNHVMRYCDGTNWLTMGQGGGVVQGANTMSAGWPDAISCQISGSWYAFYSIAGIRTTGSHTYRYESGSSRADVSFSSLAANGSPDGNWTATDCSKTIAQLYADNQAFNFVGGATAAAGGVAGNVQFNEGGNVQGDTALVWDNVAKAMGVGGSPDASAALDVTSTTKGFLPPRMTTAQVNAISSPPDGLLAYDTDTDTLKVRADGAWVEVGAGGSGVVQSANTMSAGWPDAIVCDDGSSLSRLLYFHYYDTASNATYRARSSSFATNFEVRFTHSTKAYSGNDNLTGFDCINKSIATLYSEGKAFNFVGGATAAAGGVAGNVQFNEGGNVQGDTALHWDNTNKRLGIGTTNPSSPLTVGSSGQFQVGGSGVITVASGASQAALQLGNDDGQSPAVKFVQSGTQKATIGYYDTTDTLQINAGGGLGTNHISINSSGNVGIGTTAPNAALHIMPGGSDAAGTRIKGFSISSDIDALLNGSTYGSLWEGGFQGHTVVGIRDNDAGDTFSIVSGGGNWNTDSTYDTVIMSATANGNVGIGTTVPARQLELEGSNAVIRLTDTSSGAAANGFLEIYGANGSRTGYVGDGSISNSHIYILSEDGNVYASGIGGGCYVNTGGCTSDARLKDEIEDYSKGSLLKITKLRGVTYEWKDTPGKRHVGFLAQEVQQYFPDLVEEGDDGYLTVNYRNMVVPLVEAVKELKAANDNLRSEHAAQLKSLTERIEKLEAAAQ